MIYFLHNNVTYNIHCIIKYLNNTQSTGFWRQLELKLFKLLKIIRYV